MTDDYVHWVGVTDDEGDLPANVARDIHDMLARLREAERSQPLPPGWIYERRNVSRRLSDGAYEFAVTSRPTFVGADGD